MSPIVEEPSSSFVDEATGRGAALPGTVFVAFLRFFFLFGVRADADEITDDVEGDDEREVAGVPPLFTSEGGRLPSDGDDLRCLFFCNNLRAGESS